MQSNWLLIFVVVLGILTAIYSVVMLIFAIGLKRLRKNKIAEPNNWPSLSIIVPARNEASVLPWTLSSLMKQDYPGNWEVIVVDDRSDDESPAILASLAQRYSQLRIVRINECLGVSPKKQALAKGISTACGEIIVTTDADCQYHSAWLSGLVCHMSDDVGVVAGLTIFDLPESTSVPLWQKIQWLDFFVQNFLAAGALGWNHAASCNGSNLCFRRRVYDEIAGYGNSAAVVSGDDVLFAQRVAAQTRWKMVFATSPETIVRSLPVENVRELFHQRLRWASKGISYRGSMLGFLFAIYGYYCMLLALPLTAILVPSLLLPTLAIWGTKLAVDTILVVSGANVFGQQQLIRYFPAYELLHVLFTPFFGILGLVLPYQWKGGWYRTAKLPKGISSRWLRLRTPQKSENESKSKAAA